MTRRHLLLLPALLALTACPGGSPTQEEIDAAAQQVRLGVDLARRGHAALSLLSQLPLFGCGEERPVFAGRLVSSVRAQWACAQVTSQVQDQADLITILFPDAGCGAGGHRLSGPMRLRLSGGRERFSLDADLTGLRVDQAPLGVSAGYRQCGGDLGAWAATTGTLPDRPGSHYQLQLQALRSEGLPLLSPERLVIDGGGAVTGVGESFFLTLQRLTFRPGKPIPEEGMIQLATASGRRIQATFSKKLWVLSQVEILIEDEGPFVVVL